ncbi:MAG: phosphotransferase family protein [Alphaproteobacteria bacterium]|nr:phosphotransferase family protein [Alphaproteobacteria bacterium]
MTPEQRAAQLSCWHGRRVTPEPLTGGITNTNFVVRDRGEAFVVRIGGDIPVHGILRRNELAASQAAFAAGVSPEVVHVEPGALVMRFVAGRTLRAEDVRDDAMLPRLVDLVAQAHREIPKHLRGAPAMFWVFHVVRDYAHTLAAGRSSHAARLPHLLAAAEALERAVGPVEIVFGHNDLLAANFIDDGARIWLIDWDYAGFNSPLFDLGGLASNSEVSAAQRERILAQYFGRPVTDELRRRAAAMMAAALLREAMWSMVSEIHSALDFDYAAYTADYLSRFNAAYAAFEEMSR